MFTHLCRDGSVHKNTFRRMIFLSPLNPSNFHKRISNSERGHKSKKASRNSPSGDA
jgi:hypothetical protein